MNSNAKESAQCTHKDIPNNGTSTSITIQNKQPNNATTTSTINDILHPPRLNVLNTCDKNRLSYNPTSFFMVFRIRGRNIGMILGPLLFLTCWDILWVLLFMYIPYLNNFRQRWAGLGSLISPLLTPVSFLLVFRLGRAAIRFWDARAAIGKLVEICRSVCSTAAVGCVATNQIEVRNEIARWICAYPISVKNFLRAALRKNCERRLEIGPLLGEHDANDVLNSNEDRYGPILVLNRLRELAFKCSHTPSNSQQNSMLYRQLNEQIDILTGAWGACERINNTPLPFVYVVHLRTFLMLYLVLWHLESIARNGWIAIPTLLAASWALLGIEAAAVACERPFQWGANHLALGKVCVLVAKNVAQTLQDVRM